MQILQTMEKRLRSPEVSPDFVPEFYVPYVETDSLEHGHGRPHSPFPD